MHPRVARQRLQATVTAIRERTFPYVPRPTAHPDWHLYDLAQTHELGDLLRLLRALVDDWATARPSPPLSAGMGRPRVPLPDLIKLLLWQCYRGVANRPAEGDLHVLSAALGLTREFSYKTVERAYGRSEVRQAIGELVERSNRPIRGLETTFTVDGSGFPTTVTQHYRTVRERQDEGKERGEVPRGPNDWVYNVANVGCRYGLVAGWVSWTDHRVGEITPFPAVLAQTRRTHPEMARQLGDGAYSARWIVELLDQVGVDGRFLPRRNVTLKALGCTAWPRSLWGLVMDPQEWLRAYHERSKSEGGWSALKGRHPGKIRKRRSERRETEAMLRPLVYNLRRLCYLRWLEEDERFVSFTPFAG